MSCSATVLPRSAASAPRRREARRPPDMLTMTPPTSTPAMRSAASMAIRAACSADCKSTTAPPLTPVERWWPTPSTLHRWVRPRRASDRSIGVRRATKHTIFEAPTSSTERMALLRAGIWRMRGASGLLMAGRPSWPHGHPPRRRPPPRTGARTPPRNPEIERQHVLLQDAGLALEDEKLGDRGFRIRLRQLDVDARLQP